MSRYTRLLHRRIAPHVKESPSGGSSVFKQVIPPGTIGRLLAALVVLLSTGAISASAQVVIRERVELQAPRQEERALLLDQGYSRPLPDFWYGEHWYGEHIEKAAGEDDASTAPRAGKASGYASEGPAHLHWDYEEQAFIVGGGSGQLQLYLGGVFFPAGYPLGATIHVSVSGASSYDIEVPVRQDRFEETWIAPYPEEEPDEACMLDPRTRPHQWTNPPYVPNEPLFFQSSPFRCTTAADAATPWVEIGHVEEGDIVRVVYDGAGQLEDGSQSGEGPVGLSGLGSGYWCPSAGRSYRSVEWFANLGPEPCGRYSNLFGTINAVFSVKADPAGLDHFEITFDPTPLPYQKVASVYAQAKDVDGNNVELADNTPLTITLTDGSHLGSLRRSIIGGANTTLETTYGAVKPKGGASGIVFFADGENAATLPEDERIVEVTVEKTGEVERWGSSSLEVSGDYKIELTVAPGNILHGREAILQVQGYDSDGLPVDLAGDTPIDFTLSASGQELGSLSWNGVSGASVTGVPYSEARAWKVQFVADGERREELVSMQVFAEAPSGSKSGVSLEVDGRRTRYAQGDPKWGKEIYDSSSLTIATLGCALSSLSMAMTDLGEQVTPKQLNDFMNERKEEAEGNPISSYQNGGYVGKSVNWKAVEKYTDDRLVAERVDKARSDVMWKKVPRLDENGKPITGKSGKAITWKVPDNSTGRTRLEEIDDILGDSNKGVLVQVASYHPARPGRRERWNQHWVRVVGKQGDRYVILDPGGRNDQYLDGYNSGYVWGYVVVSQNKP